MSLLDTLHIEADGGDGAMAKYQRMDQVRMQREQAAAHSVETAPLCRRAAARVEEGLTRQ